MFDEAKAFYVAFLGFRVDWEHPFEPGLPLYMQVSRDGRVMSDLDGRRGCRPPRNPLALARAADGAVSSGCPTLDAVAARSSARSRTASVPAASPGRAAPRAPGRS